MVVGGEGGMFWEQKRKDVRVCGVYVCVCVQAGWQDTPSGSKEENFV